MNVKQNGKQIKIVLTGGPSAGKTTIAEAVARSYWDRLTLVPEAASILYRGGFPRDSAKESIVCQQRAIYHVQRELECIYSLDPSKRSLICDRGTLDGLAYWPRSEEEFFAQINSSMETELARYDWVIHLDTPNSRSYQSTAFRPESFSDALLLNERIKQAWRDHPRRVLLRNNRDFARKITIAFLAVEAILAGDSKENIEKMMSD